MQKKSMAEFKKDRLVLPSGIKIMVWGDDHADSVMRDFVEGDDGSILCTNSGRIERFQHAETVEIPFIFFEGGECPYSDSILLEIVLRDGFRYTKHAGGLRWEIKRNDSDIIAHRPVPGQKLL